MKWLSTDSDSYIIRLEVGEDLMSTLISFAVEKKIFTAQIQGIGALKDFELGYYYLNQKQYKREKFSEIAELIACSGNLSLKDGSLFPHLHAALGFDTFRIVGGHLFGGTVAVTIEMFLRKYQPEISRKFDEFTGLYLLDLSCSSVP
jgi:uncharacterized protein